MARNGHVISVNNFKNTLDFMNSYFHQARTKRLQLNLLVRILLPLATLLFSVTILLEPLPKVRMCCR